MTIFCTVGKTKASRGIAVKTTHMTKTAVDASSSEFAKTKQALIERTERLNKLEDRSAAMRNHAEGMATKASAMVKKFDKKWWQL